MNNMQKTIKYIAIGFAVFLAFSIITSIVTGVFTIFGLSNIIDLANNDVQTMNYNKEYENIQTIELDIAATELEIINSEVLKVEGIDIPTDYKFNEQNGILKIYNKKASQNSKLFIYIPSDVLKLDIEIGAGEIQIENIKLNEFNLDTGAANSNIKNLTVELRANIHTGIGETAIKTSDITNLDLDIGVGNVEYEGYLRGINDIDCGVGNININLLGTESLYKIIAERGIGELKINGNRLSGEQTRGEGSNIIKISGGIGRLNVIY